MMLCIPVAPESEKGGVMVVTFFYGDGMIATSYMYLLFVSEDEGDLVKWQLSVMCLSCTVGI